MSPFSPPLLLSLLPIITIVIPLLLPFPSLSQAPGGTYIDCGATSPTTYNGHEWLPDTGFTSAGTPTRTHLSSSVIPILRTSRTFPYAGNLNKKFCYTVPVQRTATYLVRTTYFYPGGDGGASPPVFDQIVDNTLWSEVDTAAAYAKGMSTYYEGMFRANGKTMSVCLGVNEATDADPFVSAVEVVPVAESVYNSTEFDRVGLSLVARHRFGYRGSLVRYPDDRFDRIWQPFGANNPVSGTPTVAVSGFWNVPPLNVFQTRLTVPRPEPMDLQWPPGSLPNGTYYIALYFADDRVSSSLGPSRTFSISVNGVPYFNSVNVTTSGVAVFAAQWPLDGVTNFRFTPSSGSDVGPLINAAEAFYVLPRGRRTLTRDVIAMLEIKSNLKNVPADWNGDPCYPTGYSWTGITCAEGSRTRVISINLENMGLSGTLSPYIHNLTAVTNIDLGQNSITGHIPDLQKLRNLQTLSLENNQLNGTIPSFLGDMTSLTQLHLEHNQLTGIIPENLVSKRGLNFTFSPGNNLIFPSSPPS